MLFAVLNLEIVGNTPFAFFLLIRVGFALCEIV
jgi:hypothetical protein